MERDSRFDERHSFYLNNVMVMFAHVFNPDTMYTPKWSVDIILPEKVAESMSKVGFNVKEKDYGNGVVSYIKATRKTHMAKGDALPAPKVFDSGSADTPPKLWDERVPIGNGSICNVKVSAKYTEVSGKTHLPLYLDALQVVKHVPYAADVFESVDPETNSPF